MGRVREEGHSGPGADVTARVHNSSTEVFDELIIGQFSTFPVGGPNGAN